MERAADGGERSSGLGTVGSLRPRWRYLTSDVTATVLSDFADLFLVQDDPESVNNLVRRDAGKMLCLGAPTGWYLRLRPEEQIVQFPGHPDWSEYGSGLPAGPYVLLGPIVRRVRTAAPSQEFPWFIYLGPRGQLLCHESARSIVFVLALDVDELARRGLIGCELLYLEAHLPLTTRFPERLVTDLLYRDVCDGRTVAGRVVAKRGRKILLHTPGEGDRHLILCASERCLRRWWPFSGMSTAEFTRFEERVARRVSRGIGMPAWFHPLGVVGLEVGSDPFRVDSVLMLDDRGAVYHFDPEPDGEAWRIADHLEQLFRMGLLKLYLPRRRLDRGTVGLERAEAPGCAHTGDEVWEERYEELGVRPLRDLGARLRWLLREDRFDEAPGTWDERDPALRRTTKDTEIERRRVETEDALGEAVGSMIRVGEDGDG